MDINICIERLGLNKNRYRLNQSNPPHYFIEWSGSDPQPTEEELQSAWDSYIAEQAATQYQRDRKAEYDQLNQYEMMFDDEVNGTTTWIDAINAIKAKYPKPE